MDIIKYIGEATEYDKKQEVERRKVKSWQKSVSAFANGGYGDIFSRFYARRKTYSNNELRRLSFSKTQSGYCRHLCTVGLYGA